MDLDLERDQMRRTYRLCRLGFGLLSAALIVACLTTLLGLLELDRHFGGRGLGLLIRESFLWRWADVPVIWGSLIGTFLLWGRWPDSSWQRRAGLLLFMSMIDTGLWLAEHGHGLGLGAREVGHEWLRFQLGIALGWCEFALMASLAGDFLQHLGVKQAPDAGKATRSLAATGTAIWLLVFVLTTDWGGGWPLKVRPIRSLEVFFLYFAYQMIWAIALIQVTALSIAATRQAGRALAEMEWEDQNHDLLKSPSEAGVDLLHGLEGDFVERPGKNR